MSDTDTTPNPDEIIEYDLGAIADAIANAPDAGFINQNFGKLTLLPQIVSWHKKADGSPEKSARPMRRGDAPKAGETLELQIKVAIAEFNPALNFDYERNIAVRKSTAKDKSDWSEIVEPSLIAVLGKDWLVKAASQPYVCIEDVANVNGAVSKAKPGKPSKVLTVPKLVAVYANAVECQLARDKRYAGSATSPDAELTAVVDQVKGLITAMGGNLYEVAKLLKSEAPYTSYDPDQLLMLAMV